MIAFSCDCGTTIKVPVEMKGKKGKCPKCGKALVVPGDGAAPAPAAEAKAAAAPSPAPAKKTAETFAVASHDLTESHDMAVSGEITESQVDEPSPLAAPKPSGSAAASPTGSRKTPVMRFKCPHCKRTLTVPLKLAGETGKCGGCQQRFTAPVPEQVKAMRAKLAAQKPESLRDAFSVVKVRCHCGMTSAIPRGRVAEGKAKCPACDRLLKVESEPVGAAGGDDD